MTIEEDQALSSPEYWDGRYAGGGGGHEWFRSFDDLEPFLRPNLFETFAPSGEPLILHLGSGDSNRLFLPNLPTAAILTSYALTSPRSLSI